MKNLGIYCAGGLGREVFDLILRIQNQKPSWKSIYFIDDNKKSDTVNGILVLSFEEIKNKFNPQEILFVIGAGEPYIRELLFNKIKAAGYDFDLLIDSTALISPTARIGEGTVIFSHCIIGPNTEIGKNNMIHNHIFFGHDSTLKNHCMLCPGTNIAGEVSVGNNVFFGIGSVIRNAIRIGDYAIIGMGAVVVGDTEKEWVVTGNPAKWIRMNEKKRALT